MSSNEILADELGHCLGLGHATEAHNVMHPNPPGTDTQRRINVRQSRESPLIQQEFLPVSFLREFPRLFEVEILNMKVFEVFDGVLDFRSTT